MWGKHFAAMYEGSMRGKGSAFFAVWGYVISHMAPNRSLNATTVDLNPGIVAFLLGEDEGVVRQKIEEMCDPDPASRTKDEEGRKLIKLGEYSYRVVNGAHYRKIRNEEERREYQRMKQREYRAARSKPTTGEVTAVRRAEAGDREGSEAIAAERAPVTAAVHPAGCRCAACLEVEEARREAVAQDAAAGNGGGDPDFGPGDDQ